MTNMSKLRSQHTPTVASNAKAIEVLVGNFAELAGQVYELRSQSRKKSIKALLREEMAEETKRQKKSMSDVNGLMEMLMEKGLVTKEKLSEACR